MSLAESDAIDALRAALEAVERAQRRCSDAGYGSEIAVSLHEAAASVQYALATAEGRT